MPEGERRTRTGPRWMLGGSMVLLSLFGLYIASRSPDTLLYWTGLIFFLTGVVTIFNLIRLTYDEAEGRVSPGRVKRDLHYVALSLVAIALGSVLFHVLSPWWWSPIASNWQYIDDTISLTFWLTGLAFVAIVGFMAYCAVRFRHREGNRAAYEPESKKLEWTLTIGTTVAVAAMLAPGLFVWNQFVNVPEDATEIEVVGQQWSWSFRLPGEDGKLGSVATRNITIDNPLGINPDDPDGQDDVIIQGGTVHLPLDTPVKVLLRSSDVLHSFYVPEFRTKMDMVPGMVTSLWFTPTRTGTFQILCAELCGVGHAYMRGEVVVVEEEEYLAWLEDQPTFARLAESAREGGGTRLVSNAEGERP